MVGPQGNLLNRIEKFPSNILFADKCIVTLIYSYMVTNYNKFKLFEIVLHNSASSVSGFQDFGSYIKWAAVNLLKIHVFPKGWMSSSSMF